MCRHFMRQYGSSVELGYKDMTGGSVGQHRSCRRTASGKSDGIHSLRSPECANMLEAPMLDGNSEKLARERTSAGEDQEPADHEAEYTRGPLAALDVRQGRSRMALICHSRAASARGRISARVAPGLAEAHAGQTRIV